MDVKAMMKAMMTGEMVVSGVKDPLGRRCRVGSLRLRGWGRRGWGAQGGRECQCREQSGV